MALGDVLSLSYSPLPITAALQARIAKWPSLHLTENTRIVILVYQMVLSRVTPGIVYMSIELDCYWSNSVSVFARMRWNFSLYHYSQEVARFSNRTSAISDFKILLLVKFDRYSAPPCGSIHHDYLEMEWDFRQGQEDSFVYCIQACLIYAVSITAEILSAAMYQYPALWWRLFTGLIFINGFREHLKCHIQSRA